VHTIIQNIYKSETSTIEFLHRHGRGWSSSVQAKPRVTLVDLVNIEESKERKVWSSDMLRHK
jgi:hypothetical protein